MNVKILTAAKDFEDRNIYMNQKKTVKYCPKVSLIYLSESIRKRSISFGCDNRFCMIVQ